MEVTSLASAPTLPTLIVNNPREYVGPENVQLCKTFRKKPRKTTPYLVRPHKSNVSLVAPIPLYPVFLTWSPDYLYFEIGNETLTYKLWIWNSCSRLLYIHCAGLWNENARLGASWRYWPKTRFCLAPGLKVEVFVEAKPKPINPPIPCANAGLQISTGHMRDNVQAHFCVPVKVKFLNYALPQVKAKGKGKSKG